jgi:hypothetical protein
LGFICRELDTFVVKRMITLNNGSRTSQRCKRKNYLPYLNTFTDREQEIQAESPGMTPEIPRALEDFVIRLNGKAPKEERLKDNVRFAHAWIDDEFLQKYREEVLYQSIQDRVNADAMFQYLRRYALTWFLLRKGALTVQSRKQHEKEWGKYLLNQEQDQASLVKRLRLFCNDDSDSRLTPENRQLSAKVLKYTLYEINRFIRYVYEKRRSEFDEGLIQLKPWGENFLEGYEANWRVKNQPRPSRYIRPEHWELISTALKQRDVVWRHQVHLAHDYGLRRRETMGLELSSLNQNYLHLLQQLKKCVFGGDQQTRHFKALKGREKERKIPHWFADPKHTRARVKAMLSKRVSHPDTISAGFQEVCESLTDKNGVCLPNYIFHDLRRTFIANAVKNGIPVEELRQATGHKDPQVLVKYYLMDARELESEMILDDEEEYDI